MSNVFRTLIVLPFALSVAACAAAPPPPPPRQVAAPQKLPLDAKSQLETGKTY